MSGTFVEGYRKDGFTNPFSHYEMERIGHPAHDPGSSAPWPVCPRPLPGFFAGDRPRFPPASGFVGRAFMPHAFLLSCFVTAYALALALEALYLRVSRPAVRLLALAAGLAGLAAHTTYVYLYAGQLPLIFQRRWLLYLAWVLVLFYLCGEVRQRRMPWGVFGLPVGLALVARGGA